VNLLGIDATSNNLSICANYKGKVIIDINKKIKFGASRLAEYLDESLKKNKVRIGDFDSFVLGSGPGSFTGLRISFSIVKAFMLATGKKAILVESFYSCAYPFRNKKEKIAVISDARRNLMYFSSFKSKNGKLVKDQKPKLLCAEEILEKKDYFFITYDSHLRGRLSGIDFYPKDVYPKVRYILEEAERKYKKRKFVGVDKLSPLYLHPKTCQVKKKVKDD